MSQTERDELTALLSGGQHAARKLKRAQILLAADVGVSDEDIAISVAVGGSTVYRTKRRFVEGDLAAALSEEPRPGATRKLTGKEEALLVATGLLHAARGPGALDPGVAGWRDGQTDRARRPVARDGAPSLGRERAEAVAQGHVVHSPNRWQLCRPHGGCPRPLCRRARPEAARGVLRREPKPAHRRGAPTNSSRTREEYRDRAAAYTRSARPPWRRRMRCWLPAE